MKNQLPVNIAEVRDVTRAKLLKKFEPIPRTITWPGLLARHLTILCAAYSFVCVFALRLSSAEETPNIELSGLSLPCNQCSVRENGWAEITTTDERLLLPPQKALQLILQRLVESKAVLKVPTTQQMRNFLLRNSSETPSDREIIRSVFQLMFRQETGKKILLEDADVLLTRHADILLLLITEDWGNAEVWERYFFAVNLNSGSIGTKLQVILANKHPQLGFRALISRLSISNLENDLKTLDSYGEIAGIYNSSWAKRARVLGEKISACQNNLEQVMLTSACTSDNLPDVEREYIERIQINIFNKFDFSNVNFKERSPLAFLQTLSGFNYKKYRTPGTHKQVLEVLRGWGSSLRSKTQEPMFTDQEPSGHVLEMLTTFAKNDSEIRDTLRQLPIGSFVPGITVKSSARKTLREPPSKLWLLGASLSIIAICFWAVVKFRPDKAQQKAEDTETESAIEESNLGSEERRELREILASFGLPGYADEPALTQKYRLKAKEVHPDSGRGRHEEFVELKRQYERAIALISKRIVSNG